MLRRWLLIAVCGLWSVGASTGAGAAMTTLKSAYGTPFDAYVVGPENAPVGVVLAHDRWGVSPEAKKWADRFATHGYRVVLADLFDGRALRDELMTREVMAQTDPEWARANLDGALSYLKRRQGRVAMVGWGYGAAHLYQIASERYTEVDALVGFYSLPDVGKTDFDAIEIPMLGVFGLQDRRIPIAEVDDFQRLMLQLRKNFEAVTVPAEHGFLNPKNSTFHQGSSTRAWLATESFIKRHLSE